MQLAGEKFALAAGETLRMQGYVQYLPGRVSVAHGDGYLTTRRFVFCRKPRMPFGLAMFFKGRKIVFGVQFGSRREGWLLAFGAAIRQIRPGRAPRYRKELIEFA